MVIQEKPENGLDLEAKEKPVIEGSMGLGSDRGEGRGGLGEGRKSVLKPRHSGGCGPRRGWLVEDSPVQAGNRRWPFFIHLAPLLALARRR
jgi:hypothetical protein